MAELDFSKYEDLQACIEESRISITKDYIKSPEVLMVGDSTFGTLGNFSVSIGKAKSKKTFNVSAIVAAHYPMALYCTIMQNSRKINDLFCTSIQSKDNSIVKRYSTELSD